MAVSPQPLASVTVCIPCFEQADLLPDALQSVRAQTLQPLEVIVVDDGSSDPGAVPRVLGGGPDAGVRYVRVANRGLPNARNAGLMLARGDWFLPLDADDWIEPTFVEKTIARANETGADVVQVGLQEHGERDGQFMPGYDRPLSSIDDDALRHTNRLYYCSLLRTEMLRHVGGWNGRMINGWEDWDLWRDLLRRGAVFAGVDEPLFNYRVRPGSMAAQTEQHWRQWNLEEMARHHAAASGGVTWSRR